MISPETGAINQSEEATGTRSALVRLVKNSPRRAPAILLFNGGVTVQGLKNVKKGEYPFMAYLYYPNEKSEWRRFLEAAILITPEWLVSSAVDVEYGSAGAPARQLTARMGAVTVDAKFGPPQDDDEQERQIIEVVKSLEDWWKREINLLRAAIPFEASDAVRPAPVTTARADLKGRSCDVLVYSESPSEMILCLNHAIHLGVVDTFYKKRQATSAVSSSEDTDDSDDEIMENKNSSDDEADDNASYDTNFRLQPIDEIKRVLDETRSLVKLFRKSPLKNSQLQNYVKAEFGKELSLLLDVKTRWNSIIVMAERFLKLKNCVKKALIDLNMLDKWNEDNLLLLQSIVDLLQPVKIAVEALGRQNATLLTAEAIIDVLLKKIQSTTTNDDLSSRFLETLKARLEERRPQRVICLLKYLHTGHHTSQSQNTDFFTSNLSKTALIGFAEELYCRLFENIPSYPDTRYGNNKR
ncbi:hypothetical protein EVAR_18007_1 [Eumeta japonica]|uniref:Uncharacterized protein n=1 Tax=Eumeta variegata TaxID=151549 RepID=A0A4C1Y8H4_EUMVA|nr:hypothetical protein EVAR_18007_1 [Eumeta japonica]